MREKLVKRFYCDHCSKGFFKSPSAQSHEACCTKNPNRACYLCQCVDPDRTKELKIFVEQNSVEDNNERLIFKDDQLVILKNLAQFCPACVLSGLQQGKSWCSAFDYKEEVKAWHQEQNRTGNYSD